MNLTIMHWAAKWHKVHEHFIVLVSCIWGLLMDKWCTVKPLLTTTPQLWPLIFGTKYFLYLIQWSLIPKLRPPRYTTITTSLSGQYKGFLINFTPFIRPAISRNKSNIVVQSPTQWSPFSVRRISATTQKSVQIWTDLIFLLLIFVQ